MTLRDELIQVAAVAVAIVDDLDNGSTSLRSSASVSNDVYLERIRQENKWGSQHHDFPVWLAILTEEVGEAAQAWLKQEGFTAPILTEEVGEAAQAWLKQEFGE